MQFIMGSLIFIMFVVLYAEGVLPVEVDLGFPNTVAGQTRNPRADNRVGASIVFVDCPLQFVCEMETWANRDHDRFLDRLIASWFRFLVNVYLTTNWEIKTGCDMSGSEVSEERNMQENMT
nr:uncharacterized protein LOC128694567 [Cherax quadricarinatus]